MRRRRSAQIAGLLRSPIVFERYEGTGDPFVAAGRAVLFARGQALRPEHGPGLPCQAGDGRREQKVCFKPTVAQMMEYYSKFRGKGGESED